MKIFVILSRFPYPLEKGDKLRAYNQIKCLSKNNEIHLCALSDIPIKKEYINALEPWCDSIHVIPISKPGIAFNIFRAFLIGLPLQVGYFYQAQAKRKIKKLLDKIQPDHIYAQLLRVTEYVKDCSLPKTLDYQDVFSMGVLRRSQTANLLFRPILKMEYRRLLKYEEDIFDFFDHKTIISEPDRDLIPHPQKNEIEIVINGVDTDFFRPMNIPKTHELVFTGNMAYPPNVNAAEFLAKEILPLVHKKMPEVRLVLAGAQPTPAVEALKNKYITVTGWLDDIRSSYAGSHIFIAPMRIGTGLQNKLLEAMSMKIPSITSTLASKALPVTDGKELRIGQRAEDFAQIILDLLQHPEEAQQMAERAYAFVHENYNWDAATKKLETLINKN